MGNIPAHMQTRGEWRLGGRRRRNPVSIAIGLALGLSAFAAIIVIMLTR